MNPSRESAIAATNWWLENVVIGLNLCPFAKAVHLKNQIRFRVSSARNNTELMNDFQCELQFLMDADPEDVESTLLIHPGVLNDFANYNMFLVECDQTISKLDFEGAIQVASFHPQYQFEGTQMDDVTNYTNRSPYPTLHLLREESVTRAVESFPNVESIYKKNITTLEKLGTASMLVLLATQPSTERRTPLIE